MFKFTGAFQSCFDFFSVFVARAGISIRLISSPVNFNNYMVSHQQTKHMDQQNILFKTRGAEGVRSRAGFENNFFDDEMKWPKESLVLCCS